MCICAYCIDTYFILALFFPSLFLFLFLCYLFALLSLSFSFSPSSLSFFLSLFFFCPSIPHPPTPPFFFSSFAQKFRTRLSFVGLPGDTLDTLDKVQPVTSSVISPFESEKGLKSLYAMSSFEATFGSSPFGNRLNYLPKPGQSIFDHTDLDQVVAYDLPLHKTSSSSLAASSAGLGASVPLPYKLPLLTSYSAVKQVVQSLPVNDSLRLAMTGLGAHGAANTVQPVGFVDPSKDTDPLHARIILPTPSTTPAKNLNSAGDASFYEKVRLKFRSSAVVQAIPESGVEGAPEPLGSHPADHDDVSLLPAQISRPRAPQPLTLPSFRFGPGSKRPPPVVFPTGFGITPVSSSTLSEYTSNPASPVGLDQTVVLASIHGKIPLTRALATPPPGMTVTHSNSGSHVGLAPCLRRSSGSSLLSFDARPPKSNKVCNRDRLIAVTW